jgi:hypothetical protein
VKQVARKQQLQHTKIISGCQPSRGTNDNRGSIHHPIEGRAGAGHLESVPKGWGGGFMDIAGRAWSIHQGVGLQVIGQVLQDQGGGRALEYEHDLNHNDAAHEQLSKKRQRD